VLWKDIWAILRKLIQPLTLYLIIATIPAVIFFFFFKKPGERAFDTGHFVGVCSFLTSAFLVMAELLSGRKGALKQDGEMNWLDALIIGIMQAIAIIPGVSRSGATLSGALSRKLDRGFAARFSFILSIPVILGAAALQLKDVMKGGGAEGAHGGMGTAAIIAGTISAAVVSFFAVKLMIKIVKEKSLWGFAIYTGILGLLVLFDQYVLHLVF
jgi:undecaprenyl-diphosphatase